MRGANGILYFLYNFNRPLRKYHPEQWKILKQLAGEMRDMKHVLFADVGALDAKQSKAQDEVLFRLMQHEDASYTGWV